MNEKVVNTRITQDLYDKIMKKAKKNGTTISTLVRDLLEDSIDVYSDVSKIIDQKIRDYLKEDKVVGYQEIVAANVLECANCSAKIKKGDKTYMVVTEKNSGPKLFLCSKCFSSKS